MTDEMKNLLETQKLLEQSRVRFDLVQSPVLEAIKALQNSPLQQLLEEAGRQQSLMRLAVGPLADLRLSEALVSQSFLSEIEKTKKLTESFESHFRLPDSVTSLAEQLTTSPLVEAMARYSEQASSIQKAMEAMQTPWLDIQRQLES